MKVTFILKTGATIDTIIPEAEEAAFNFNVMCANTRLNGYFQTPNMHLKYDDTACILFASDEAPAPIARRDLQ